MGQSPSADIYWGYDLKTLTDHETYRSLKPAWWDPANAPGADEEADELDWGVWEPELARRLGWVEAPFPNDYPNIDHRRAPYDERQRLIDEYKAGSALYQAYRASEDHKDELLATIPIEIDTYGYSEDENYYTLRVKASVQHVDDWGSIPLEPLVVEPEWADKLAWFIELLELTVPDGGPGWHLNCSYG